MLFVEIISPRTHKRKLYQRKQKNCKKIVSCAKMKKLQPGRNIAILFAIAI